MEDEKSEHSQAFWSKIMNTDGHGSIGAVVIGRNEGERLKRCLSSIQPQIEVIVYVDSGSTDGSIDYAKSLGIEVIGLDLNTPFSAGRARNAGAQLLLGRIAELEYIQFVDGDCELCEGWVTRGVDFLWKNRSYAVVSGNVNERSPEKSIYNELCNAEWARFPGDCLSCGGIFLVRREAFFAVGGFNPTMIAGEEPEFCFRLRQIGWKLFSLDYPMTLHDAEMLHFHQWWRRTVRTGYAYAHRWFLHKRNNDAYLMKALIRIWFWSLCVPLLVASLAILLGPWALLLLLSYPAQLYNGYKKAFAMTSKRGQSFRYALFNMLSKWPQLIGQLIFLQKMASKGQYSIIEYK
jgi:glycosyltransferase involved in cell wall biosynthesis